MNEEFLGLYKKIVLRWQALWLVGTPIRPFGVVLGAIFASVVLVQVFPSEMGRVHAATIVASV